MAQNRGGIRCTAIRLRCSQAEYSQGADAKSRVRMNFQRLKYFHKVAELQSFRGAADALNISQPALSRHVALLEHEVGTKLFVRVHKRTSLTPAGTVLFSHASHLLDEVEFVMEQIRKLAQERDLSLSVGAVQSTYDYVVPKAINALRREKPDVHIAVHGIRSDEIVEGVARGQLDIGIVGIPVSDPRVTAEFVQRDVFKILVGKDHPLARVPEARLEEILSEPLITFPEKFAIRSMIDAWAKARGIDVSVAVELESIEAMKALVRPKVGLTILPGACLMATSSDGDLVTIRISGDPLVRDIFCVHRTTEELSQPARCLIRCIGEVFAEVAPASD